MYPVIIRVGTVPLLLYLRKCTSFDSFLRLLLGENLYLGKNGLTFIEYLYDFFIFPKWIFYF